MKINLKFKHGFTLAEVLITLGIIGVVAAITLPTLIQNYKKQVYVNQLKKSVSTLEQGFKKMLADEGVDSLDQIPDLMNWYWTTENNPYFVKYFKKVATAKEQYVYPDGTYNLDGTHVNGIDTYVGNFTLGYYYLSDGTLIGIELRKDAYLVEGGLVGYVIIDVNGDKKLPNKWGRDIFHFFVFENGSLLPGGGENHELSWQVGPSWRSDGSCGKPNSSDISNTTGYGCAARIIENGWKMDY
jgi:prepilin-type N-terminal cleavage/methylation domain-containing protein